jgi:hypothetical protein
MPEDREYEGPQLRASRSGRDADTYESEAEEDWADEDVDEEVGSESETDEEWLTSRAMRQTGAAAAGLLFGLALGAGLAILFAPRTGEETRELLGERARQLRGRAGDRFDDLREDLGRVGRRGRRRMGRGVTRGRWAAEDVLHRVGW